MKILEQYNQEELEQIVKFSTSYRDLAKRLGYSHSCSGDTVKNLKEWFKDFDTSHFVSNNISQLKIPLAVNIEDIFVANSQVSQNTVRKYYRNGQYSEYKCSICQQEANWNGKKLTLILDHVDGCNNNNVLSNLRWVCPNCNSQLPTTGSRNPNRKIHAKKYYCQDCGKEISKGSQRCAACESMSRRVPLEKMEVTREVLKELIRNKSFVEIGKQFSVSDNAIRKWCIKYNLPSKKTEINKISNEDWLKI